MLALITLQFFLKLVLLAALAPIWWPILKALHEEVEGALREEGGLFGKPLSPRDLERYEAEHGRYESGLVNEPFARGRRPRSSERSSKASKPSGGPLNRPRRKGFG